MAARGQQPADSMDPLGGLFDQFLGPDGLDGLRPVRTRARRIAGAGRPSGGSEMADRLLRQLLDEFMRELAPAPDPTPEPDATPAPTVRIRTVCGSGRRGDRPPDAAGLDGHPGVEPGRGPDPFAPDEGADADADGGA